MVKYSKQKEIQIVKLFRFGKQPHIGKNKTYMRIKDIAKFLNKSTTHVSMICKELKQPKAAEKVRTGEISLTIN